MALGNCLPPAAKAEYAQLPEFGQWQRAVTDHVVSLPTVKTNLFLENSMQKKIIALAVAGLMSGAAFAQASNVQIYGRVNTGFENYSATGSVTGTAADLKARNRVFDSGSRLGFRGTEDLGGGLKAGFVIESGLNIDNGTATTQGGAANASTGTLSSRSSWMWLGGNFGEVRFGRQDLYWGDWVLNQTGANYISTNTQLSAGGGGGLVNGPLTRTSNVVSYTSPKMGPFTGFLAYHAGADSVVAGVGANTNANGWSARGMFDLGAFKFLVDHTVNTLVDAGAATGTPRNSGSKLGAGWAYQPGAQVALIWTRHQQDNIAAAIGTIAVAGDDLKQNTWTLNWEHTIGNVQLLAQYAKAGNASGMTGATTGDSSTKQYLLGARYLMSKRTALYASYNSIKNGELNFSDFAGAGMSSGAGVGGMGVASRGADPRVVTLGVIHNF